MTTRATITLWLAIAASAASAAGPAAGSRPTQTLSVSDSVTIGAAPDIVWSTVRDYDAPSLWQPFVTSTNLTHGKNNTPGAKRHMTTSNGGTIDDTLTAWNARQHMFATRVIHTAMPIRHYRDRITVKPTHNGSRLTWQADFQPAPDTSPANARNAVKHRIEPALTQVKNMLGSVHRDASEN